MLQSIWDQLDFDSALQLVRILIELLKLRAGSRKGRPRSRSRARKKDKPKSRSKRRS